MQKTWDKNTYFRLIFKSIYTCLSKRTFSALNWFKNVQPCIEASSWCKWMNIKEQKVRSMQETGSNRRRLMAVYPNKNTTCLQGDEMKNFVHHFNDSKIQSAKISTFNNITLFIGTFILVEASFKIYIWFHRNVQRPDYCIASLLLKGCLKCLLLYIKR